MTAAFETDAWPLIRAKHYGVKRIDPVRFLVVHTPEFPEKLGSARALAKYFQNPDYPASTHIVTDDEEIIQCVPDSYIAYGAKGANRNAIHMEMMGYAKQSRMDWLDSYSIANVALSAYAFAQYCLKYDIPPIKLTNQEIAFTDKKGIVGHDQITKVYKESDHTDPGPNFPWRRFICMVAEMRAERQLIA